MKDHLDSATDRARANAAHRRKHIITWGEQREFFERHREEFGEFWPGCLDRYRDGYARYRDDAFWYNVEELQVMEDEEEMDKRLYRCLRLHQDEINDLR